MSGINESRAQRIARARQELAERYAADPEGVAAFNLRMARLAEARKRERQRVEMAIRGGADPEPEPPALDRPDGVSRRDWKALRQQRQREYRARFSAWSKKQGTIGQNIPTAEQLARAPFTEREVTDYQGGRLVRIGRAYCRQPRFETIEGLTAVQLAALRRYRRVFDASELSPVKSGLDIGPGGGSGGAHGALLRVEAIAFADIAVTRIESAIPHHDLPVLRAVALQDQDFKAVALDRYGSASGQRRTRIRNEFVRAVDSLVRAMAPPPRPAGDEQPSDACTATVPAGVSDAFLDERGYMRPMEEIAEIILANLGGTVEGE
ncbi:hypothetical protein [Sphingomonas sp. ACRSK]|uniref:hypothetical protein n=1 Tax=Sphingomonas sp. ACRSK TaxID=2918213 RepID=UPI001EF4FCBA|nr:hypothetical protein [Sphingomonas sp. ACRSK]MCG7348938.1 hypothetical protein [Sphingomonas sp. ACRSK]